MAVTERKRSVPITFSGDWKGRWDTVPSTQSQILRTHQFTTSEGHAWPSAKGTGRDIGGEFYTIRSSYRLNYEPVSLSLTGRYGTWYNGQVLPNFSSRAKNWLNPTVYPSSGQLATYHVTPSLSTLELNALGATAISKTIPTNPAMDGAVGIAELFREGLPSMIGQSVLKDRTGFFRDLGGEYLNYQFGWAPLVADVKAAAKSILESEKLLLQLQRDSGKNVRRRFKFPEERSFDAYRETTSGLVYPWPNPSGYLFTGTSGTWRSQMTIKNTWFSGSYTYHYDPGDLSEISRIATQARHLFGLQLTPEVLWNLAPWSWLTDWVFNTGDVLKNMSAFSQDGLVLRYGYLMHNIRDSITVDHYDVKTYTGQSPYGGSFGGEASLETKRRIRATPYGFGYALNSLSNSQWSILGALGLTRLPKAF